MDLYANLNDTDTLPVYIRVGSSTSTTATTTPSSTTATATSVAPTQTRYIYGCHEFFTVESGDDCSTMETEFGVTLAQLYEWNPSSKIPSIKNPPRDESS
jgi:LysM repeat protein